MSKEVTKWLGKFDQFSEDYYVGQVKLIESPKQVRIVKEDSKEYRRAHSALGFHSRWTHDQATRMFFDSREDALAHLEKLAQGSIESYQRKLQRAKERLLKLQKELQNERGI